MRQAPARLRTVLAALLLAVGGLAALAQPAAAAGSLTATLSMSMSGTTGTYTVTNIGTASVSNWTITFTLPAGVTASTGIHDTVTQNGTQVTITPAYYIATLAPGRNTYPYSPTFTLSSAAT